jgi:hypothetical protein
MKARFDELAPFYVNGTLSDTERAWVDDYLREHPGAAAELKWYESLQTRLREDAPAVSSEVGLERAIRRIRAEGPAPVLPRRAAPPTLFERVRDFLASVVPQPVLRPALAGALAVVAVQAVVIVQMTSEVDESQQIRAIPGAAVEEQGPYLKVSFKPDAREADIRLLLVRMRGSLAAGPGQLGDYYVRVPQERFAAASDMLRGSAIVDTVAVVDGLPPRE